MCHKTANDLHWLENSWLNIWFDVSQSCDFAANVLMEFPYLRAHFEHCDSVDTNFTCTNRNNPAWIIMFNFAYIDNKITDNNNRLYVKVYNIMCHGIIMNSILMLKEQQKIK